jgi:hypothetical protein
MLLVCEENLQCGESGLGAAKRDEIVIKKKWQDINY